MLRRTIVCLAVLLATADAFAADQAPPLHRDAVARLAPRVHVRKATVVADQRDPDVLISIPTTPLLPGSQALPGYYGRAFSYDYQGAYYGGSTSYVPYFFRMPYACGVIGYC